MLNQNVNLKGMIYIQYFYYFMGESFQDYSLIQDFEADF